jgi:SEC-C motif-containing protein
MAQDLEEFMENCPCGSGRVYDDCCGQYITGKAKPATAEALMRSRYSAYEKKAIDYIVETCLRDEEHGIDIEGTRRWSENSSWHGLKILATEKGGSSDEEGLVEFKATYTQGGLRETHHEKAAFSKKDGIWLYVDGEVIPETVVRESPKVGRNDPCPCGSGKKYKKCHGASDHP